MTTSKSNVNIYALTALRSLLFGFFLFSLPAVCPPGPAYAADASITIASPNGAENLPAGSAYQIKWTYTGKPGSKVKIVLLKGDAVSATIARSVSVGSKGKGSYKWTAPASLAPGNYKISVTSTGNSSYTDTSDDNFSISAPTILVGSPAGGETWNAGSAYQLKWTYTGNPGSRVKIVLLKGDTVSATIARSVSVGSKGKGSYKWTASAGLAPGDYKISITSTGNSSYMATGNAFKIKSRLPSGPTGVKTAAGDGQVTISWSPVDNAASYNIYWSTSSGNASKTSGTKIANAAGPYTHTQLTNGTAYYYVVTAVNSFGQSVESESVSATPSASISSAGKTDSSGRITVDVFGNNVTFQAINEATGLEMSGLVVGFAANSKGQGVLMIIDPTGKFPSRIIKLQGPSASASSSSANSKAPAADQSLFKVILGAEPSTAISSLTLNTLPKYAGYAGEVLGIFDLLGLCAQTLNAAGLVTLGEPSGDQLTNEEAMAELKTELKDGVRDEVFMFMATGGVVAMEGLTINLLSFGLNANTVVNCGLPGQKITRRKLAWMSFYNCERTELSSQVNGLVKAAVGGVDQYGLPLGGGSLELISKDSLGNGFAADLDGSGKASLSVPIGDYEVNIESPGFKTTVQSLTVPQEGTSLNTTLQLPPPPPPTEENSCCSCSFDVYCTAFGQGGCYYCSNVSKIGTECPVASGALVQFGLCQCDADRYEVCQ